MVYNIDKIKEREVKRMIWVTYEVYEYNEWETRMKSCTKSEYERMKNRKDIIIIRVEKVKII